MADKKYYVLCGSNCKYESMTKEQIIAAIAEATGKTATDVDAAFITKIKDINKGAAVQIWLGTTAEYKAISNKRSDVFYIKTDDSTLADIENYFAQEINRINSSLSQLQGEVSKKAEFDDFVLNWNTENNVLEADEATILSLCNALDAHKNIKIVLQFSGGGQMNAFVESHENRFICAFHYAWRKLFTWRVYEDEITLYHAINLLDDPIVDKGTINGWNYRKWDSGRAECWGEITRTTTPWGTSSLFSGGGVYTTTYESFPFEFTQIDSIVANCTIGHQQAVAHAYRSECLVNQLLAVNAQTNLTGEQPCITQFIIKGRWK